MVCADSPEVDEQPAPGAASLSRLLPQSFRRVAGMVHAESKQIEDYQHAGQGLTAMSKVVLKVIAVIFQNIECFIFYFPT